MASSVPAWPHTSPPCRATSSDSGSTAHPFKKRAMLTSRRPRHAWANTGVITTIGIRLVRARLFNAQAFVSLRPAAIRTPASTNRTGIHQLGVHLGQNIFRDSTMLGLPLGNRLARLPQEPLKLVWCQRSRITRPSKTGGRHRVLRHGHIHNDTCRARAGTERRSRRRHQPNDRISQSPAHDMTTSLTLSPSSRAFPVVTSQVTESACDKFSDWSQ
jgi:hypothetical protein